jgi:hypothetical protein
VVVLGAAVVLLEGVGDAESLDDVVVEESVEVVLVEELLDEPERLSVL